MKISEMKDIEVVNLAKQGEDKAFEELYRRFFKLAYYFAMKLCNNETDAYDVVQESFMEVRRSLSSLRVDAYFKAWLYRIVDSKCKKVFRKNKHVIYAWDENIENKNIEEHREFVPEKEMRFKNDQELLQHFINCLPNSQKEVIILFYLEELSLKEISEVCNVPVGTIKSRLSYARTYLRQAIEEYQGKEQETVNFHQIDAFIVSSLLAEVGGKDFLNGNIMKRKGNKFQSLYMNSSLIAKVALVSSITLGGGIVRNIMIEKDQQYTHKANELLNIVNASDFKEVKIHNDIYDNEQDAYLALLQWACCKEELMRKSKDEIHTYYPLYQELKENKGRFYQLLIDKHWASTIENSKK